MDNGESHSFDPYFGWGLPTKCCRSPSQAQAKADGVHLYLYYRMEHLSIESRRSARISIAPCNSRSTLLEQMYNTKADPPNQIHRYRTTKPESPKYQRIRPTKTNPPKETDRPNSPAGAGKSIWAWRTCWAGRSMPSVAADFQLPRPQTPLDLSWWDSWFMKIKTEEQNPKNQSSDKVVLNGSREVYQDFCFANQTSARETTRHMSYIWGNSLALEDPLDSEDLSHLVEIMTMY